MKRVHVYLAAFGVVAVSNVAAAACSTYIGSVPYVISAPGDYCLSKSVQMAGPGQAITIAASDVNIDLRGFSIVATPGNPLPYTVGIGSAGTHNVWISNGRIKGFTSGVELHSDVPADSGILIEGLVVRSSTLRGIVVFGGGTTIQDNVVSDTAARFAPGQFAIAINAVGRGGPVQVLNNRIDNTRGSGNASRTPGSSERGIGAEGIVVHDAPGSAIADNTVTDTTAGADKVIGIVYACTSVARCAGTLSRNEVLNAARSPQSAGVRVLGGTGIVTTGTSISNDIENFEVGLSYVSATGVYIKNVVAGALTPYSGGQPIGTNDIE